MLAMEYAPSVLGERDPHTVVLARRNATTRQWQDVPSTPAVVVPGGDVPTAHTAAISTFGDFAVMAGLTWRDRFLDFDGLATFAGIRRTASGALALSSGATQGSATSVSIVPIPPPLRWAERLT